jgi:hypothetical protein
LRQGWRSKPNPLRVTLDSSQTSCCINRVHYFWATSKYEDRVADIEREQQLRRAGWEFWRIRESEFYTDPERSLEPLWLELERRGIHPGDLGGLDQDQADSIEVWEPMTLDEVEVVGEFEDDAPASRPQPTDAGSSSRRLF